MRQVLFLLRGAVHSRQGAQPDFGFGARGSPPDDGFGLHGNSAAWAKRKFLQRFGREAKLRRIAGGGGGGPGNSTRAIYDVSPARFWQRYYRCDRCGADTLRPRASAGAKRIDPRTRRDAAALYSRAISRTDFMDEGGAAGYQHH